MSPFSLFSSWQSRSRPASNRPRKGRRRKLAGPPVAVQVQTLEDRTLPSAFALNLKQSVAEILADVEVGLSGMPALQGHAGSVVESVLSRVREKFDPSANPVVTGFNTPVSYTAGGSAVKLDSTATVTDSDTTTFDKAVLRVSLTDNRHAGDTLAINNQGTAAGQVGVDGHDVTYGGTVVGRFFGGTNGTPLVVRFNDSASTAAVQAVLDNITYQNTNNSPNTDTRTFAVRLTDGEGGLSNNVTDTIDYT